MTSSLSPGQMSRTWITERINKLIDASQNAGVGQDEIAELTSALQAGKIKAMVVKAKGADGAVDSISFQIKDWWEIGVEAWQP